MWIAASQDENKRSETRGLNVSTLEGLVDFWIVVKRDMSPSDDLWITLDRVRPRGNILPLIQRSSPRPSGGDVRLSQDGNHVFLIHPARA
jgi:hypothetical protein